MRKQLNSPQDLYTSLGPSFLGHVFRLAYFGYDDYYAQKNVLAWTADEQWTQYSQCRQNLGMHTNPGGEQPPFTAETRPQYTRIH